jgi:hypothetical protein
MKYPEFQYIDSYLYKTQTYDSPYLFALAGQPDIEGPVNYDIYAGFNRSIYDGSRVGVGLGYVDITLIPNPHPVCIINLDENTYETNNSERFEFTALPEDNMAALKIALDPVQYRSAEFEVIYGSEIEGWTLNIGDSATNNGGGGDGCTQSNDAELQVRDKTFKLFGNDLMYYSHGFNFLYDVQDVVNEGEILSIKVADCRMKLKNRNGIINTKSPYLYALAGQQDWEGSVNYDIYAGFNRVIRSPYRRGRGVSKVTIMLKPGPAASIPDLPVNKEDSDTSDSPGGNTFSSDGNEFGIEEVTLY